jgi:N-carbamoylputrescine amidase
VLGSRPVIREGKRLNEAFCWAEGEGHRTIHDKYYLPNEEDFWEAEWYNRSDGGFVPIECKGAIIGFQICTEL